MPSSTPRAASFLELGGERSNATRQLRYTTGSLLSTAAYWTHNVIYENWPVAETPFAKAARRIRYIKRPGRDKDTGASTHQLDVCVWSMTAFQAGSFSS
jgi:hypothetical protein